MTSPILAGDPTKSISQTDLTEMGTRPQHRPWLGDENKDDYQPSPFDKLRVGCAGLFLGHPSAWQGKMRNAWFTLLDKHLSV